MSTTNWNTATHRGVINLLERVERECGLATHISGRTLGMWTRGRLGGERVGKSIQLAVAYLSERSGTIFGAVIATFGVAVVCRLASWYLASHDDGIVSRVRRRLGAKREVYSDPESSDGGVLVEEVFGAADNAWDDVVWCAAPYSAMLVSHLRLYTTFVVRDYNLLRQCVTRAGTWIRDLGDQYEVLEQDRWKLLAGSVARAMVITPEERAGWGLMEASGCALQSRDYEAGILHSSPLRDYVTGSSGLRSSALSFLNLWSRGQGVGSLRR